MNYMSTMKNKWKMPLYALIVILILSGCSNKEDAISWMFFSELTNETGVELEELVMEHEMDVKEETFNLQFFSPIYERLIGEIAAHNGDIIFVEEELLTPATFDAEGLQSLDAAVEEGKDIPDKFKLTNLESGEENVYALPIEKDSILLKNLDIDINKSIVALVPIYSDKHNVSIKALADLSQTGLDK